MAQCSPAASWPQVQVRLTTPMKLSHAFCIPDYHPVPWFLVQDQAVYGNSKHRRRTEAYINGWGASLVVEIVIITGDASGNDMSVCSEDHSGYSDSCSSFPPRRLLPWANLM